MTIQVYLQKETFLKDLKTIESISEAGQYADKDRDLYQLEVSTTPFETECVAVNLTLQEFAAVSLFKGAKF